MANLEQNSKQKYSLHDLKNKITNLKCKPNCLLTYLVLTYFQTYFAFFQLLQARWQPSCSTVDYGFNGARLKPELLSRDGYQYNCTRVFNLIANVNKQLIAYFGQIQLIAIL